MKLYIFAALTFLVIGPVFAETQPDRIVEYKKVGDLKLSLHIFNPSGHKATDKTPVIVFFFGGGWVNGTPRQFYRQSKYLAYRGMVAICADYRVKSRHGTSPKECVKDAKSAVRWVRSHASKLGIDPNKLAVGGGSAGGHIAAATGTLDGFNEKGEDISVNCRPNAMVLFNPVFDNAPGNWGHKRVKKYWKKISPAHNIDKNTPPAVIFLGTKDKKISVTTAKRFKEIMEDAGNRCDLHLYKGQEHAFFNEKKYYETLLEADKFLTSLGYLRGNPTLHRK